MSLTKTSLAPAKQTLTARYLERLKAERPDLHLPEPVAHLVSIAYCDGYLDALQYAKRSAKEQSASDRE